MHEEPVNPVIYVSNSAWNLFDLLVDFIDLNDIPKGPLLLRDIDLEDIVSTSTEHKLETVRDLLERYPELPVVLVGDSGQHDAEIYAQIMTEHPDRIRAIYIRDVDPADDSEYDVRVDEIIERSRDLEVPFLRVRDSSDVAAHAVRIGLLPDSARPGIEVDTELDEQREELGGTLGPNG